MGRREYNRLERFLQKVHFEDGCLIWDAGKDHAGYGMFHNGQSNGRAHRVLYEFVNGAIPPNLGLDHLCRRRDCVNPLHMEAVTQRVNVLRGEGVASKHARRTHCLNGHPFSGDNLRLRSNRRECITCMRAAGMRYYWKRKAARNEL